MTDQPSREDVEEAFEAIDDFSDGSKHDWRKFAHILSSALRAAEKELEVLKSGLGSDLHLSEQMYDLTLRVEKAEQALAAMTAERDAANQLKSDEYTRRTATLEELAALRKQNEAMRGSEMEYRRLIADILLPAEDRHIVGKTITDEDNLRRWTKRALELMAPGCCWDRTYALAASAGEKPAGEGPGVVEVERIYRRAPSKED